MEQTSFVVIISNPHDNRSVGFDAMDFPLQTMKFTPKRAPAIFGIQRNNLINLVTVHGLTLSYLGAEIKRLDQR